jgi:hypothetical protein
LEKTTGADGKQRKSRAKKVPKRKVMASAEISPEQRRAEHAALDPVGEELPTEEEPDESWQNDLYDQACLLLERMADATRQRFFAYLADADHTVERALSLVMAMTDQQRSQFFCQVYRTNGRESVAGAGGTAHQKAACASKLILGGKAQQQNE